jgi:integrase
VSTDTPTWPLTPGAATTAGTLAAWSAMAGRAYAPNTVRAWRADWRVFTDYCARHGLDALPAVPHTVRGFVFDCLGTRKRPATVRRYVATISRAHTAASAADPTDSEPVRLALKEMGRTTTARQRQARALTWEELKPFLERAPESLADLRDRALLAVAYDTLCRREELVSLCIEDLVRAEDGSATILIRRSKTDAAGEGSAAWLAPTTLKLVEDWLGYTGLREGLLFRRVYAGSRIGDRLSPGAIAPIVKRAGRAIGLPANEVAQLSGHSTRVGAAQDLLALNIEIPALMQAGRWKDTRMPLRYGERVLASRGAMARAARAQGR